MTIETNIARIVEIDLGDSTRELESKYNGKEMTVPEFNSAMREIAQAESKLGGYSKLRGKFVYTEITEDQSVGPQHELEFRIDVDREMSEGATLMHRLDKNARFFETDRGKRFCEVYGGEHGMGAKQNAELYRQAAMAALVAQHGEKARGEKNHV